MRPITTDELLSLVATCDGTSHEDFDELLTDLLVQVYPTLVTQDN